MRVLSGPFTFETIISCKESAKFVFKRDENWTGRAIVGGVKIIVSIFC